MKAIRVAIVCGTRPEAIKLAPVVRALSEREQFDPRLVLTGQHRELLDQALSAFELEPAVDLNVMRPNQGLGETTARLLTEVQAALAEMKPDAVLVQGDTSTCLAAALAAFYERIPVGHVEAGLRTYDLDAPWPEEMNRRLVDPISRWCFAPTSRAADHLHREGIDPARIFVTGNTVIDALTWARDAVAKQPPVIPGLEPGILDRYRVVLVTGHRRESFGEPFRELCESLAEIARTHPDVAIVFPVHLNPNVRRQVDRVLTGIPRVHLLEPLEYLPFVRLLDACRLVITDSGGIQEEAPTFGKPVLIARETTERPEAVESGVARLVGTKRETIVRTATRLLADENEYRTMVAAENPFGDGRASSRIVRILAEALG